MAFVLFGAQLTTWSDGAFCTLRQLRTYGHRLGALGRSGFFFACFFVFGCGGHNQL